MLAYSRSGKLCYQAQILASVPGQGDESVLGVGCEFGGLLIGAGQLLNTGRVVGAYISTQSAVSGNRPETHTQNAILEEVAGQCN